MFTRLHLSVVRTRALTGERGGVRGHVPAGERRVRESGRRTRSHVPAARRRFIFLYMGLLHFVLNVESGTGSAKCCSLSHEADLQLGPENKNEY
ncbi:hypothetical protein EVAR_80446_1 [Eumeta japonica]|uniref:Uncharacterized protein n=1 Tax=Eumeta variegata TaxID=151549 RepID=A0A4C1VI34_EUMVA|nr:hypothetical protein EVAR_80446_1 [Eumeta japonica]